MRDKTKELQKFCEIHHLDLVVRYYGNSTNFEGINDDEKEVFNVCVWYQNSKDREFYIEVNSIHEHWHGGSFTKEDMLLLLSVNDLSDEELNLQPLKE